MNKSLRSALAPSLVCVHTKQQTPYEIGGFVRNEQLGVGNWSSVGLNNNASIIVTVNQFEFLYMSYDYGVHWVARTEMGMQPWTSGASCKCVLHSLCCMSSELNRHPFTSLFLAVHSCFCGFNFVGVTLDGGVFTSRDKGVGALYLSSQSLHGNEASHRAHALPLFPTLATR